MRQRSNARSKRLLPLSLIAWILLAGGICRGQLYKVSTIAGGALPLTPVAAANASIGQPSAVAIDAAGNLYVGSDNCIFKVDPSGQMTLFAGTSRAGYSGDGGPATGAQVSSIKSIAFDSAGNAYIADFWTQRLRKVSTKGVITTVAGGGGTSPDVDGTAATSAFTDVMAGVAVDAAGTFYFSEFTYNQVRKVPSSGVLGTAAGNGTQGNSGDGGPARSAELGRPYGLAFDNVGNLYIADTLSNSVRKVTPEGIISTYFKMPNSGVPTGLAVDSAGDLYIADQQNSLILKVSSGGTATTVAGTSTAGFSGDGDAAASAQLNGPTGVAVDASGNLYIADTLNNRVRKVSSDGIITTVAGNGSLSYSGDGGPATSAQLNGPQGLAADHSGNVFIADFGNNRVRKISSSGIITTVAGNGVAGFSGDGGPAASAELNGPAGIAVDSAGDVFFADSVNNRVRKVSVAGIITTVAGNGSSPPESINPIQVGDGEPATSAELSNPLGVAVDASGNLYIADTNDNAVRKVSTNGIISTVATGGSYQGTPTLPVSIAVDNSGDLFMTIEGYPFTVTEVAPSGASGTVYGRVVIGNLVAVDGAGDVLFGAAGCSKFGRITPNGVLSTIAGTCSATGFGWYTGDGGPALDAIFGGDGRTGQSPPQGMAADVAGNVYVADTGNNAIRLLQPTSYFSLIGAVQDAASETDGPVTPGKIVAIYGSNLGPNQLVQYKVGTNGQRIGTTLAGTSVSFNGIPAPVIYSSASQVAAVVPYEISGTTAEVTVTFNGQTSAAISLPIAVSAPSLFTLNETGAGQASVLNGDGTINNAANPVKIGGIIWLYATGEGQTSPPGSDGKIASAPLPHPVLPVHVTVDGQPATVLNSGATPGGVEGLMLVEVQIPGDVQPGGYVPVVLQVGTVSSQNGVTIAVAQ